jgi:hypothetical protein
MIFEKEFENIQRPFAGIGKKMFVTGVGKAFVERHFPGRNIGLELGHVCDIEKPTDCQHSRLRAGPGKNDRSRRPVFQHSCGDIHADCKGKENRGVVGKNRKVLKGREAPHFWDRLFPQGGLGKVQRCCFTN